MFFGGDNFLRLFFLIIIKLSFFSFLIIFFIDGEWLFLIGLIESGEMD